MAKAVLVFRENGIAKQAADNQAQSGAITRISSAIGTMDQTTQQNAAMVEQTSAAARNLAAEVGGLSDQAARFNVGTGAAARPAKAPAAAGPRKADARAYASPVKPLPAAGVAALVRPATTTGTASDPTTPFPTALARRRENGRAASRKTVAEIDGRCDPRNGAPPIIKSSQTSRSSLVRPTPAGSIAASGQKGATDVQ